MDDSTRRQMMMVHHNNKISKALVEQRTDIISYILECHMADLQNRYDLAVEMWPEASEGEISDIVFDNWPMWSINHLRFGFIWISHLQAWQDLRDLVYKLLPKNRRDRLMRGLM